MTQPCDRTCLIEAQGAIDRDAGEFWVENPFQMPAQRENLSAYERNHLFMNVDGRSFVDVSHSSGADLDSDSRSVIVADFNGDQRADLLVSNVGGGPLRLLLNRMDDPHRRVRLQLTGVESNRQGIGARVVARCGDRTVRRDLFPVNGFMGQGPAELLLGLGTAATIDELTIHWPAGTVQTLRQVPTGGRLVVDEQAGIKLRTRE